MHVCSWIFWLYTQTNGNSLHGSRPDGILGLELGKPIDWTTEKLSLNLILILTPFSFRDAVLNEFLSAKISRRDGRSDLNSDNFSNPGIGGIHQNQLIRSERIG